MQLSLLYLRQGKNDLAKAELQRIIALSPTYANARWYLSVVLEQEGDIAGALAQVEEIARTNPEHEAVQQRLERLKSGEVEDDVALPDPLPEETVLDPEEGIVGDEGSEIVP
jgi:tetratricopeptide (TPR) repeat protein